MRCRNLVLVFSCLLGLAGCASNRVTSALPEDVWQDAAFAYQPTRVTETRETLFALDKDLVAVLTSGDRVGFTTERRLDILLSRLYGPSGIRLVYTGGHSTGAAQTWRDQKGDCLSLTILSYAAARFLGIDAHMQEVRVPIVMDRRNGLDVINGHVNLFVRNKADVSINGITQGAGSFVIDFEPQAGSLRPGLRLSEDAILARYYNNRAAQHMAQRDDAAAYAYYRAAIALAPDYAPALANLAQLYARRGYFPGAEQLVRRAMPIDEPTYVQLAILQRVLSAQGRDAEAMHYAALLEKRQHEDPYYWLERGLTALRADQAGLAVKALEQAAELATGFEEIHYNLGLAYWRNGQWDAARKQLDALSAINSGDPAIAQLSKKLRGKAPTSAHF